MKRFNKVSIAVLAIVFLFGLAGSVAHAATSPSLGTAGSFSILAGTPNITDAGSASDITGDVGLSPATGAGIGLLSSQVTGTIFSVDAAGPAGSSNNPGLLTNAKADLVSAFDALSAVPNAACDTNYGAVTEDLSGKTLVPGVYCANAFNFTGPVALTLDDTGAANGVWIFRSELSTLNTTPGVGASVVFLNGIGSPCNVWWKVSSSATIGSGTEFIGNILALTSISMGTNANLDGRILARNGAVTLDHNTISNATCGGGSSTSSDIKVKKTASDYDLNSGPKKVTFTYKVTNEGDVALTDISVKDDKCDDVNYVSGDDNDNDRLDKDEEWKYTCKKTVKKTETNTVTAKGTVNGERMKDTDTARVTVSTPGLPSAGFASDASNLWDSILAFFSF